MMQQHGMHQDVSLTVFVPVSVSVPVPVSVCLCVCRGVWCRYDDFCDGIARQCGGVFRPAPIKSLYRAVEKLCWREFLRDRHGRKTSRDIYDILRGALEFSRFEDIVRCIELLVEAHGSFAHSVLSTCAQPPGKAQ